MNPSHTVRKLAAGLAALPIDERRALLEQFADELAVQHNQQNNAFAVALGRAEENWHEDLTKLARELRQGLADVRHALREHVDDSGQQRQEILGKVETVEERQRKILELLEGLQDELRGREAGGGLAG